VKNDKLAIQLSYYGQKKQNLVSISQDGLDYDGAISHCAWRIPLTECGTEGPGQPRCVWIVSAKE
jgi:hypothetical protein